MEIAGKRMWNVMLAANWMRARSSACAVAVMGMAKLRRRWQKVGAPFAILDSRRARLFERLRFILPRGALGLPASGGLRLRRVIRALCVYFPVEPRSGQTAAGAAGTCCCCCCAE